MSDRSERTIDTIDDLFHRATLWVALEDLLFETLGEWARSPGEPAVKRSLATWCHRHAWHAELWRSRTPVIPHRELATDADDIGATLRPTRDALAIGMTGLVSTVLPALGDSIAEHRAAIDPLLDGPTDRILTLVAADLDAEIAELRATA